MLGLKLNHVSKTLLIYPEGGKVTTYMASCYIYGELQHLRMSYIFLNLAIYHKCNKYVSL